MRAVSGERMSRRMPTPNRHQMVLAGMDTAKKTIPDQRQLGVVITANGRECRNCAQRDHPGFRVDPLKGRCLEESQRTCIRRCPIGTASLRDTPGKIEQIGGAQIFQDEVDLRIARKNFAKPEADRNDHQGKSDHDAGDVGRVRRKPKAEPDAVSMTLFGPGVAAATKPNRAMARIVSIIS